jgi:thioredoxin 1
MDATTTYSLPSIPSSIQDLKDYSQINNNKLIVIDFKATWCNPCKAIKPFVEYLKENYPNVEFHEVDIEDEDHEDMVQSFEIKKVPTFVYYKNGTVCGQIQGTNKEKIEELINDNL